MAGYAMSDLAANSKKLPRGKSFEAGKSGNPTGRPKRTETEVELIEACKQKTPEALDVIVEIMRTGESSKVRLSAANMIIERGYGKPVQQQVVEQTTRLTFEETQARRMMEQYLAK